MTQRLHTEQEYKDLLAEHQIVQRKLENKVEALLKVSQELAECQHEKQTYKTQAQEYAERCKAMKMAMIAQKRERNRKESAAEEQQHNLVHVFKCVKEENKSLNEEIESLKSQLEEARCDIKLMKAELSRQKLESFLQNDDLQNLPSTSCDIQNNDKMNANRRNSLKSNNDILQELEKIKCEYGQLERDLKTLLCEKEELIVERDAYKMKSERQNSELNFILNGDERRLVDVDSLVGENRYLKERLENAREENGMAKAALSKYKGILEKAKRSSSKNDNSNTSQGSMPSTPGIQLITAKQARAFLGQSNDDKVHQNIDYRALATALFEAVGDKTLALSHLRKANKILGNRVTELENKLNANDRSVSKSPCKIPTSCHAFTQYEEYNC